MYQTNLGRAQRCAVTAHLTVDPRNPTAPRGSCEDPHQARATGQTADDCPVTPQ